MTLQEFLKLTAEVNDCDWDPLSPLRCNRKSRDLERVTPASIDG